MSFVRPICNQESERDRVTIIPGNRYFRLGEERGIFQQLLPLEAEGREVRLHLQLKFWIVNNSDCVAPRVFYCGDHYFAANVGRLCILSRP